MPHQLGTEAVVFHRLSPPLGNKVHDGGKVPLGHPVGPSSPGASGLILSGSPAMSSPGGSFTSPGRRASPWSRKPPFWWPVGDEPGAGGLANPPASH